MDNGYCIWTLSHFENECDVIIYMCDRLSTVHCTFFWSHTCFFQRNDNSAHIFILPNIKYAVTSWPFSVTVGQRLVWKPPTNIHNMYMKLCSRESYQSLFWTRSSGETKPIIFIHLFIDFCRAAIKIFFSSRHISKKFLSCRRQVGQVDI